MAMIAKIFKALLIDNVTKDEFATATLEEAGVTIDSATQDVEGGGGLVSVLHLPKKESINLKDVRFHFDILAKQLGCDIVIGAGEAYAFPVDKTIVLDATVKTITLPQTPKTSANVKLYKANTTTAIANTDYTITGTDVEFTGIAYEEGDIISVGSYIYATSATTGTITINNSAYRHGITCVLETLEIDELELPLNTIQIVLDKCVFDGSVKIDTKTKTDAVRHDFNLKCLNKIGEDIAGRIVRIPIETGA